MALDPVWTKQSAVNDRALDPLALGRIADRLTEELLLGITTQTSRARYFSFYTWCVDAISKNPEIRSFKQFQQAFRQLDKVYSLGCVSHEQETGDSGSHGAIIGSRAAEKVWAANGSKVDIKFRHFGNQLGGYGAYYQASLLSLGLTVRELDRDIVTPLGERIARSFQKSVHFGKFEAATKGETIPRETIRNLGRSSCLCLLAKPGSNDRELLREMFFGLVPEHDSNTAHIRRKQTLALILYLVEFLSRYKVDLDAQKFLDSCYYHQVLFKSRPVRIPVPAGLDEISSRWRTFRAHDYFRYACEMCLSSLLRTITSPNGLSLTEYFRISFSDPLSKELARLLRMNSLRNMIDTELGNAILMLTQANSFARMERGEFDQVCNMNSQLSEHRLSKVIDPLIQANKATASDLLCSGTTLLCLLFARFLSAHRSRERFWSLLAAHTRSLTDKNPDLFILDVEKKIKQHVTLGQFLFWFFRTYILSQADEVFKERINVSSLSIPASWITIEGETIQKQRDYDASLSNSRFFSCYQILVDLALCRFNGNFTELSPSGVKLLENLGVGMRK